MYTPCAVHHHRNSHIFVHMSTGETPAIFRLSKQNGDPSMLNDDSFMLYEHRYPGDVSYQVIRYITNMSSNL